MSGSKRSPLVLRAEPSRSRRRDRTAFAGTCRIGDQPTQEVQVADLSPDGCRLVGAAVGVTKGEPVEVHVGPLGPIAARLRWARRGSLGVAFDAPLDAGEIERLGEAEPVSTVIPLRRRSEP